MDKMEAWRQVNNELRALYHDEVAFGSWRYLYERFGPGMTPRVVARWYVNDLAAM